MSQISFTISDKHFILFIHISISHLLGNIIYVEAFPGVYELSGAVNGGNVDMAISKGDVLTFTLSATS